MPYKWRIPFSYAVGSPYFLKKNTKYRYIRQIPKQNAPTAPKEMLDAAQLCLKSGDENRRLKNDGPALTTFPNETL